MPNLEIDHVDHIFVEHYHPKFLGKGGEQVVYGLPEYPTIVAKANKTVMRRVIDWNVERGLPPGGLPDEVKGFAENFLAQERRRHQELTKYFGVAHVPRQRSMLVQVPVTPEILEEVYQGPAPATLDQAWTLLSIQQRVPELVNPDGLSLACGYAENREQDSALYEQVTARAIQEREGSEPLTKEVFFAVQQKRLLKKTFERAEKDPEFKTRLTECLEKTILYATETGEILDLVGEDNISFVKTEKGWTYKLVDAFYAGTEKMVDRAREVMQKASQGTEIDAKEKNILLNTVNFVRTVNGMAELLGMAERIHLVSDENRAQTLDFLTLVR